MTVRDLITGALRLCGVLASGESMEAAEAQDALQTLNALLGSWNLEKLLTGWDVVHEIPCTGADSYTLGPGGSVDAPKPVRVSAVVWRDASGKLDRALPMADEDAWRENPIKILGGIPEAAYYEAEHPMGLLSIWPQPSTGTLRVYAWRQFEPMTLDSEVQFPTGFDRALRYALALELAPEYGRALDAMTLKAAGDSLAAVKRANVKPIHPSVPSDVPGMGAGCDARVGFLSGR